MLAGRQAWGWSKRIRSKTVRCGPWPGDDPNLTSTADLEPLRGLIGDATVAAFGESYHASGGFYRMKHRVLQFLVDKMGFRAFAMETGWEGALLTETYVQTGPGTPEYAISQHINVWHGTEYADLVRWIRQWKSTHPAQRTRSPSTASLEPTS